MYTNKLESSQVAGAGRQRHQHIRGAHAAPPASAALPAHQIMESISDARISPTAGGEGQPLSAASEATSVSGVRGDLCL